MSRDVFSKTSDGNRKAADTETGSASFRRAGLAGFAVLFAAYFFTMTRPWSTEWFTEDDFLNIYYARWTQSWAGLVAGNVFFFGHVIRPLPALFNRLLYTVFGFDPAPFNVVRIALCALDVILMYAFASRLSRSREVGVLCVLLAGFHPALYSLYFESGMIYDVGVFLFYYSGLLLYLHWRREGQFLGAWRTAAILLAYIAGSSIAKRLR